MEGHQSGLVLDKQDPQAARMKYAAKAVGHDEIEVHLNPESNHQGAGSITGCKVLRVYPAGTDRNNVPKYDFVVGDGDIKFAFNEEKFAMCAHLLDDKERGTVSPVGYNRDLLASHIDLFIVPDPAIAADVQKRAEKMMVRAAENDVKRKAEAEGDSLSVNDIDEQMEELQKRKEKMLSTPVQSTAPVHANKPPEIKQTTQKRRKSTKTPEQKAAWGAAMKAAREKKKAEKAKIAPVPKEENAVNQTVSEVGSA